MTSEPVNGADVSYRALGADVFADEPAPVEQLPTPPLRLRRVRLQSVGPDGARFDPLDLDFATRDGAAARVLLSLTNTGGKSTWITLVSSLIVPASRAQIAGKILGDYVLTGDTAHIVCEWEDATTGIRTVTGTVMEWKDRRRQPGHKQRSTTNMHRAWYLFRTGPGLPGVDDLPFIIGERRATFEMFCVAAGELVAAEPRAQWVITRIQQEWTTTLEQRTSIDPVLFGYQMRMNDSEAGAEKLLATFDSPDNVVRFFVAALNDDREITDFTSKLKPYAELAGQRRTLQALAGFGEQVAPHIELIAQRKTVADAASAVALGARIAGGEHCAALANRITADRATLEQLAIDATQAAAAAAAARREYGQISDIRLQLQLELARIRLTEAVDAERETTRSAKRAAFEAAAWEAVDAVLEVELAQQERDAAQLAYDAADLGLAPLRNRVVQAAASLAGRLEALIAEAEAAAETADGEVEEGKGAQEVAISRRSAADRDRDEASRRLETIREKTRIADEAVTAASTADWLSAGEQPEACLRRWTDAVQQATDTAEREEAEAAAYEAAFDEGAAELLSLDLELIGLRGTAQRDLERLTAFEEELAALGDDSTVTALLGDEPADTGDTQRAADLATRAAEAADARARIHDHLAAAAREELAYLDEAGTTPTGPDVLTVLRKLLDERMGAVSGLEWIERNVVDPDARPAFIAARPDIAGGVIVSDPQRFEHAVTLLSDAALNLRTPITVTTAPSSADPIEIESRGPRHIVPPHRATWDRGWAASLRDELESTALNEGNAATGAHGSARAHRTAAAACLSFATRWQGSNRAELTTTATASGEAVSQSARKRKEVAGKQDTHRDLARQARTGAGQARDRGRVAERRVADATVLIKTVADARTAESQRAGVEAAHADALRRFDDAKTEFANADHRIKSAMQTAAQARANRQNWHSARNSLAVEQAAEDPGGNLSVVETAFRSLRDELSAAEQGLVEAEFLKRTQRRLAEALDRRGRFKDDVLELAAELSDTIAASSRESLSVAQDQAKADASSAESALLRAAHTRELAEKAVRDATPPSGDRTNHFDLVNAPRWQPDAPSRIPDLLAALEVYNEEVRTRRDEAEQAESDAVELRDAVDADITAFGDTIAMWPADPAPTERAYTGTKADARAQMLSLVKALREADSSERRAASELRDAVTAVRSSATDARWRELDAPAAVRVRSLSEIELVAESAILARRVRSMGESAAADLANLDTHRTILRDNLVALCREQRRLLREVSRASRLPHGLGEISDQPAIKIRFDDAPDDEAATRLADRIDTWAGELADNPKRANSADVRARWLADAVRDTVLERTRAGAWSIEILKPRIDGRAVYCPPERIPHEFCGGQVLTLAVLVYCALSGVRSSHRPGGARPPGALILDNPFGAASNETLIAMQHQLSARTGLQLICATGLHDPGVDAAFTGPGSVIAKLRNDGDIRRNLSYLRLRNRVVDGIDLHAAITADRDTTSPQNWVDATAYEIRR